MNLDGNELQKWVIILSHKYQFNSLHVILEEDKYYERIIDYLDELGWKTVGKSLAEVNESNRYCFGKVLIELRDIVDVVVAKKIGVWIQLDPFHLVSNIISKNEILNFS